METEIIDGNALSASLSQQLKREISHVRQNLPSATPTIVDFYDPEQKAQQSYAKSKAKTAELIGINYQPMAYNGSVSKTISLIEQMSFDFGVHGIILQQPAPGKLAEAAKYLNPKKDIDGLTPEGRAFYVPATTLGVLTVLEKYIKMERGIDWQKRQITVMGATGRVGKVLVEQLLKNGADSVMGISRSSVSPEQYIKGISEADILISATGNEKELDPDLVKSGVIFINVGRGHANEELHKKARLFTPPNGGTGPMTVYALCQNGIEAWKRILDSSGFPVAA